MERALSNPMGLVLGLLAAIVTIICIPLALMPAPEVALPMEIQYASQIVISANAKAEYGMVVGDAEVNTDDPHPRIKHGEADVTAVREAMKAMAAQNTVWWNRPPCKDGRYRYVLGLADGTFAVWVLDRIADRVLKEITAFITDDQNYVKGVGDGCGNGGWLGPVYGG